MFILFGFSIEKGMRFLGPYPTEGVANYERDKMEDDEKYDESDVLAFSWKVVELISVDELHEKNYTDELTQVR